MPNEKIKIDRKIITTFDDFFIRASSTYNYTFYNLIISFVVAWLKNIAN